MIDSVLKGTGNSRFLKSAVPAGTSWADALAMLQAGTFPIDFNGINTEGFQQVGTPLNKANLLKDATAAQIGLPPSTTPDGMFQALGNTGELHVWRKTVAVNTIVYDPVVSSNTTNVGAFPDNLIYYSDEIRGTTSGLELVNPSSVLVENATSSLNGKYIHIPSHGDVFYKLVSIKSGSPLYTLTIYDVDKQERKLPDEVTYPVSTNPNAYQEGDDAKPAGYTLGDVVTGSFRFATNSNHSVWYHVSDSLNVADDGTISLGAYERVSMQGGTDYNSSTIAGLKGKFIQLESNDYAGYVGSPFSNLGIYYVPSDAVFSGGPATDRYQPVTGYAAIPAGTTIEYLGKLGDKSRVQVVSYVGTGTYGSDHPNSLTFDFVPKVVMIRCDEDEKVFDAIYGMRQVVIDSYYNHYITLKWSKKTLSWYSDENANKQMNYAEYIYHAIAIG